MRGNEIYSSPCFPFLLPLKLLLLHTPGSEPKSCLLLVASTSGYSTHGWHSKFSWGGFSVTPAPPLLNPFPQRGICISLGAHTLYFSAELGIPSCNSEATGQPHTTHLSTALWAPYGHQDLLPHPPRPIHGVEVPSVFFPSILAVHGTSNAECLCWLCSHLLSPQSWDNWRSPMQPPELPHCAISCTGRKPGLREVK